MCSLKIKINLKKGDFGSPWGPHPPGLKQLTHIFLLPVITLTKLDHQTFWARWGKITRS